MYAKLATAHARHKSSFDRSVRRTLQFNSAHHQFVDSLPAQTTELAGMEDVTPTKLLLKTLGLFKVIPAARDTVRVGESGIHNTVRMQRGTVATYNAQSNDGKD